MRRAILIAYVATLVFPLPAGSQDPRIAVRVNVPVVSFEALVLDSSGRPITTLERKDFALYEDGQPKEIQNFSAAEVPYSILLMFQNSRPAYNHQSFLTDASNRFLDVLRAQDRVSIYTMDASARRILDWRNVQTGTRQEIKMGTADGPLRLYASIDEALGKFSNNGGRKAMLVLTSGQDVELVASSVNRGRVPLANSDNNFQRLLQKARSSGIPLYFIAIDTDRNRLPEVSIPDLPISVTDTRRFNSPLPPSGMTAYTALKYWIRSGNFRNLPDYSPTIAEDFLLETRLRMELLAVASGGRIYFPKSLDDVAPMYKQIGEELGRSYSFGYASDAAPGTTHRIELRVTDPAVRVIQSRESYTVR